MWLNTASKNARSPPRAAFRWSNCLKPAISARPWAPHQAATVAAGARLAEFGSQIRFRHPLVRSAAYRSASVQPVWSYDFTPLIAGGSNVGISSDGERIVAAIAARADLALGALHAIDQLAV